MSLHTLAVPMRTDLDARILLVEDDVEMASMLASMLAEYGFQTVTVGSAPEMDRVLNDEDVALVVLDVMLPGEDGLSTCRRLRSETTTPILMLTALRDDVDRIVGLEFGADDYVTKPFNSRELVARIKSLLRRASYDTSDRSGGGDVMAFAGWRINATTRQLRSPEGALVSMTTAEFDVLLAFCRNPGRVLSREQLLTLTYAGLAGPVERSIDVHVSRVRGKIEPNQREPTLIKTVRLGGYQFTPEVEAI